MTTGLGILAIWHDIRHDKITETLDWYDREHHQERLAIPGFRSVRRYHAVEAEPFLFIRYETDGPDILTSPAYLTRLNAPTDWTKRSQPGFLGNIRSVCTREARQGWAEGGFVVSLRLTGGGAGASPDWPQASKAVLALDGIVGAELWRADPERSTVATDEKRLRGREDGYVAWAALVHATTLAAARAAAADLGRSDWASAFTVDAGIYQLALSSSAL